MASYQAIKFGAKNGCEHLATFYTPTYLPLSLGIHLWNSCVQSRLAKPRKLIFINDTECIVYNLIPFLSLICKAHTLQKVLH